MRSKLGVIIGIIIFIFILILGCTYTNQFVSSNSSNKKTNLLQQQVNLDIEIQYIKMGFKFQEENCIQD